MNSNPWHRLPQAPPFVLPQDEAELRRFTAKHPKYKLRCDLLPEPFVGRPEAPLVLLGNNPGAKNEDTASARKAPAFMRRMRENLTHQLSSEFPMLYLDPSPDIPGGSRAWWERKFNHLFKLFPPESTARSLLAKAILAVEFFPYVSNRFAHGWLEPPSRAYSFDLVRIAVERGAVIVLTRGHRRWLEALPMLGQYKRLVRLKEVQRAPISPGNCEGDGYDLVRSAVERSRLLGSL
jgi:hypothetical protein